MKGIVAAVAALTVALTAADPQKVREAKALYFDRKYAEARGAWQAVLAGATGREAEAAAYWIARSSESLGEHERAFREFGAYLRRRPGDPALRQEARLHQLGLAARLYKDGQRQRLSLLTDALRDPSRNVRDYAALQLSSLGPEAGRVAVPVLKDIVASSADEDLVQRATLGLLRLDPGALAGVAPRREGATPARGARWLEVRIYDQGAARPKVYVRLPMVVAEILYKSLPEEARRELRRKGYHAESFWNQLGSMAPGEVLDIQDEDGDRIRISLQ